ncbi:hypothetical protein HCDG_00518 [Histoplasma capsulatum H143]|uniref:Uncharacterized protein n=1 Tax=Ajellomyces capsulatus (strain H143) TaxID=544712 RepID=C6H1D6_AJECH|nr:hypothetical protein HCDG_00518 [Histoplasma capsulatum H143]
MNKARASVERVRQEQKDILPLNATAEARTRPLAHSRAQRRSQRWS